MRVIRRLVVRCAPVKNGLAVADRIAAVNDIGKLAARRLRGVENMFVPERNSRKPQERKYLEAVAVVVGDAEQRWVGIKRQHRSDP